MNERIKAVRKALGLTQAEFAERLGINFSTVSTWESGNRGISNQALVSICREFGVDELWLREGVGEMFRPRSRADEISAFMGNILKAGDEDFRNQLIGVLTQLSVEEWSLLEKMATKLAQDSKKETEGE